MNFSRTNTLNCWNWKHPIRSIKNAYWRITKGFCPEDTWDWYTYQANLIHDSLMYLAANHYGTMMEYENDDKGYTEKLEQIANTIFNATNYEDTYPNPFRDDYYKSLDSVSIIRKDNVAVLDYPEKHKQLFKHYMTCDERNYKEAKQDLKEALNWIADHWFDLWD